MHLLPAPAVQRRQQRVMLTWSIQMVPAADSSSRKGAVEYLRRGLTEIEIDSRFVSHLRVSFHTCHSVANRNGLAHIL